MAKFEVQEKQIKYRSVKENKKSRKVRAMHNQCLRFWVVHQQKYLDLVCLLGFSNIQPSVEHPVCNSSKRIVTCCFQISYRVFQCPDSLTKFKNQTDRFIMWYPQTKVSLPFQTPPFIFHSLITPRYTTSTREIYYLLCFREDVWVASNVNSLIKQS